MFQIQDRITFLPFIACTLHIIEATSYHCWNQVCCNFCVVDFRLQGWPDHIVRSFKKSEKGRTEFFILKKSLLPILLSITVDNAVCGVASSFCSAEFCDVSRWNKDIREPVWRNHSVALVAYNKGMPYVDRLDQMCSALTLQQIESRWYVFQYVCSSTFTIVCKVLSFNPLAAAMIYLFLQV